MQAGASAVHQKVFQRTELEQTTDVCAFILGQDCRRTVEKLHSSTFWSFGRNDMLVSGITHDLTYDLPSHFPNFFTIDVDRK